MEISNRFIEVQGIRTHFWIAGEPQNEGPERRSILLLHGGSVDCAKLSWELLIPELARDYQVIAPDFPGYGESDKPEITYSVEFYVGFITAFLDALGIRQLSLAGLSMGGSVALGFALRFPQRVESLILVDSYGLQQTVAFHKLSYLFVKIPGMNQASWSMMRSRSMVRYTMQSFLKRPGAATPELIEQVYQEANRPGAGKAWNSFQDNEMLWNGTRTWYIPRLGEITAPTLIIQGSKDTLMPGIWAKEAHERIRGSRLEWMDGCGHWPQRDNPAEFNRVVAEFLAAALP